MDTAPVAIYQFLPNPTNEDDEWIELKNNSSDTINLSGYYLDDEPDGGSKPYKIPAGKEIAPNSLLKFPKSETKIALNNSKQKDQPFADTVRLLNPQSELIDIITYTTTKTDEIISRSTPTPIPPTHTPIPSPIQPTMTPFSTPTKPVVLAAKTEAPEPISTQIVTSTPSNNPSPTPTEIRNKEDQIENPVWPGVVSIFIGISLVGFSGYLLTAKLRK